MKPRPGLKYISGDIVTMRDPNAQDMKAFYRIKAQMPSWVDDSVKPILAVEGWLSRVEPDRIGDIIEPLGWQKGLAAFMENPALMFNHSWDGQPGTWIDMEIREEGLYGKSLIYGTRIGQDVALLVRAGVLRSFSAGFNAVGDKWEWIKKGESIHFMEQELIEGSIVSVPMHLLAKIEDATTDIDDGMDAVLNDARSKGLQLKYFTAPHKGWGMKGVIKMNPDEVKKIVNEGLAPVDGRIKEAEVTVKEVKDKAGEMSQLISELKQAAATKTSMDELRTLVDKATGDFIEKSKGLDEAIKGIKASKTITTTGMQFAPKDLKSLCEMQPREVRSALPTSDAEKVIAFGHKALDLQIIDALLDASSRNHNGGYHVQPKSQRVKGLHTWRELEAFVKALDTETATEGLEWVHTMYSGELLELVRLEEKVAPLFPEIIMPSATFTIDSEGADTIATLAGQVTSVVSSLDTTEQTFGTANISLTAKKARGRYQISTEMTEESAVAILPIARTKIVRSIARAVDRAIINADDTSGSHIDTGYTVAATDFRKAWDGLRYHWITNVGSSLGVNLGTCDESNWVKVRGNMGKYGIYPSQLAHIISIKTYLLRLMDKAGFPSFQTLDKYGPNAVIMTGELGRTYNVPNVVSEFMEETQDATGIYSGAGNTRASQITVNREMWLVGIRRGVEVLVDRDILNDVYQMVAYKRCDFKPTVTPSSTEVIVNVGYNIPTAA